MGNFKVGDKVYIDSVYDEFDEPVVGTVTSVRQGTAWVEWTDAEHGVMGNGFPLSDLSPVEAGVTESNQFDKFMDRILITENRSVKVSEATDSPQRKIAKLYREKAANRTVFRRGGTK